MGLTLISSSPSPYARKIRIALAEKCIPFTLRTEIPWDSTTETPSYNPLEKLPVLILEDGKSAVYESHFIFEWLEEKGGSLPADKALANAGDKDGSAPHKKLLPDRSKNIDAYLKAKEIEVVADGASDALILWVWETRRDEAKQSREWLDRQTRKVNGAYKAMNKWVEEAGGGFLVDGQFGLADIAVGSFLGFASLRNPESPWKENYPKLKQYWEMLETRHSFKDTVPFPFEGGIKDKVV